ncbi:N-(5'-phospho-L-ribosyl-formimino)-5-amino-1-(5'-phosphoribosyl)-4-imidazolecarboxamide isomerase [Bacteroidales bacterium]|nr:N-(5'-phospho-L-ribosyl-formimino)-5-amino-1-(5'-phosphoribosyl)-4-imidazolecarboxamide isomerase [Bacteroidales bacterium]
MIEIIPAIDIIGGKCVRLSQGDYEQQKTYSEHPLEVAKAFEDNGIKRLHLVDLDGAKAKRIINYKVLEQIASKTSLVVDFGGGLKSQSDLKIAFESGAQMITGGSIAIKSPEIFAQWLSEFGASRIILGADCKDEKIAISGWVEKTEEEIIPFISKWKKQGVSQVICTDIAKDGMLQGPSIDLYKKILEAEKDIYLVASGGVSCIKDIDDLQELGVPAVIFGKAFYEGKITFKELKTYL